MRPILEVSDLSVQRGAQGILQALNWQVAAGQHWAILGSNGSGKTSLLSTLCGYLTPSHGEISVLGERFGESDWRALRTRIGLVSSSIRQQMAEHEPGLVSVISGKYAMIDFWGQVTPTDRAAARRILRLVEATPLADRPWRVLSQGERQRILIGRALMAKPKLLILDEPCAGLDPVAREHFLGFLQRLGSQRAAPTLLLVTHHVEEIMPVFTHALLLRAGRILAAGPKAEVLSSKNFSLTFDAPIVLRQKAQRYQLAVRATPRQVF